VYGRILVEQAAEIGDVEQMQGALSSYGYDEWPERYLAAVRTAANRKDRAFVQALRQEIGCALEKEAYATCKLDKATPGGKGGNPAVHGSGIARTGGVCAQGGTLGGPGQGAPG
jgi:hypothetical protein